MEGSDFFQRVRDAYHQRASVAPERYALIDASQSLTQVQTELQNILEQLLD